MSTLMQDLRYGLRRLRRSPGFSSVCVVTLALGIGANTAIFSLVDAVMLKSLPVADPGQLYRLGAGAQCCVIGGFQGSFGIFSWPLYTYLRDHTPEFSEMAAFQAGLLDLSVRRTGSPAAAEPFIGEFVSGNYFRTFGIPAYAGRTIMPGDDQRNAAPVAVISYRAWRDRFGLDRSILGASFTVNQTAYTVVGIAPPGFFGDTLRSDPPDFWLPLGTEPVLNRENSLLNFAEDGWLYSIGRLKPGVRPEQVEARLTTELQQWWRSEPDVPAAYRKDIEKQYIRLTPGGAGIRRLQRNYAQGLRLLIVVSGLVLLIACANVANLLMARGAAAQKETAVRVALGAGRWRVMRQTLTESVLLALAGAAAGIYVAYAGTETILLLAFRGAHYVPISASPSITVLGFALAMALVTGIVFGVAPAWISARLDPADGLRGMGRSTGDRSSLARRSLLVVQVALSLVLLIGAGLLTQSLRNLEGQRFGFETRGRMMVRVDPSLAGYTPEMLHGLYQRLQERLPHIPGVLSASFSLYSPMRDENWASGIHVEGRAATGHDDASWNRVSAHYFETVGTRVLRGRAIDEQDTPNARHVAVVNEAFARKFFGKENPIGRRFGIGGASHAGDFEIVGVVEDAKYLDAREAASPTAFLPLLQMVAYKEAATRSMQIRSNYIGDIELRVAGDEANVEGRVRRALAEVDPNLTVLSVMSFGEQLALNFNQERLMARLTGLFGLLALVLACVGLYGVTAFWVGRRRAEIGVRMALGADRGTVVRMLLRTALLQVGVGMAIGIPAALVAGRIVAGQLYGVRSYDPVVVGVAVAVLAVCAAVAGAIPARRAASIDPMQALRME